MARDAASAADSGSPFFFFFVCADKDTSEESGSVQAHEVTRARLRRDRAVLAPGGEVSRPYVERDRGTSRQVRHRGVAAEVRTDDAVVARRLLRAVGEILRRRLLEKALLAPEPTFLGVQHDQRLGLAASARLTWYGEPT